MKRIPQEQEIERDPLDDFFVGVFFVAALAFACCVLVAFNPPVGPL